MKSRRLLSTSIAAVAVLSLGLAGCSSPTSSTSPSPNSTGKTFTIGSAVIVSHPALQAAQDGFEAVLKENNVNYTMINQNAQNDTSNAATIASNFHSNPNIDLILAISTPIAQAMASAEKDRPIIFTAVTDPVTDGLVPSWDQAGSNITGTSDQNPGAKPVSLVQEVMPNVKTIGVLYSSSESNSLAQLDMYKTEAASLGVTLKPQAVTSTAEITAGLQALAGVDAILVPTDNTVVNSIATVISFGQENKIPIFCADTSTVTLGTVATRGLNYNDLGRAAGEMAVKILVDGTPISQIPPEAPTSTQLYVNPGAAESFGLTLPDDFVSKADFVETTTQ
ncbi:MAG: ABC transporter substrate-binding protein [Propionibacteriaceae bacterium]|nr:ABC transporter substrate-binding protein [Propionibacteriaceae bacterium]